MASSHLKLAMGRHGALLLLAAFHCWLLLLLGVSQVDARKHNGLKDMPKHPDAKGVAEYLKWIKDCGVRHERKVRQKERATEMELKLPVLHSNRMLDLQPEYPDYSTALLQLSATTAGYADPRRKTIIVSKNKTASNFTKVQDAIDSVPANNKERVVIWVQQGIYREKVKIPSNKPFIHIYGDGMHMTSIEWGDTASTIGPDGKPLGTFNSATFICDADWFIATGVSFVNTAPVPPAGAIGKQAVAARITGDKAAFYYVSFYGAQDTLYDHRGRHYFQNCFIQGSIDFIVGNGRSVYQSCRLHSIASPFGAVTAQKRELKNETTGFSFIGCSVTGTGTIYMGRAWGIYSRVVFSYTFIDDIITPEAWYNWGVPDREKTVFYGTYKCFGPGANTSTWPAWAHRLTTKEVAPFLDYDTFIDADEWLPRSK